MSWATIRDGMAARLNTIQGLSAVDTMRDTLPDKDVAVVLPGEPLMEPTAHRGKVGVNVRVVVMVSRASAKDAQDRLDEYVNPSGARSVIAAIAASRTTGQLPVDSVAQVDDTRWVRTTGYGPSAEVEKRWQADVHFYATVTA